MDSSDNGNTKQPTFVSRLASKAVSALGVILVGTSGATANEKPAEGAPFAAKTQSGNTKVLTGFTSKFFSNQPYDYSKLTKEDCEYLNKFVTKSIEVTESSKGDPEVLQRYYSAQQSISDRYKELTGQPLVESTKPQPAVKLLESGDVIARYTNTKNARKNFEYKHLTEQECRILNKHLKQKLEPLSKEKGHMQEILDIQMDRNNIRNRYYELTNKVDIPDPEPGKSR